MDDYQPRFSRNSLNILMLMTVGLIVLFNLPQLLERRDQLVLPTAPPLDVDVWHTDSGARVWFSPFMAAETLHLELWYSAGSQFAPKGEAILLSELIRVQSQIAQLPVQVNMDQDFIKLSIQLSPQPTLLSRQLNDIKSLIYFPVLPTKTLQKIRSHYLPSASQALRSQLYNNHPYDTATDLSSLTRADVQSYHHKFLHPKRLQAVLVGDVSQTTARVILERLLPVSKHAVADDGSADTLSIQSVQSKGLMLVNWPPLQNRQMDTDMSMGFAVLKSHYGDLVHWQLGLSNSLLSLQANPKALLADINSETILTTKRQLALKWIRQTHTADSLSRYLIKLNAYDLPQDYMRYQIERLQAFDQARWQQALDVLLETVDIH